MSQLKRVESNSYPGFDNVHFHICTETVDANQFIGGFDTSVMYVCLCIFGFKFSLWCA